MHLSEFIQKAREIREAYAQIERQQYGRAWTSEELALGFLGDVGDLMKLIQACEGIRNIPNAHAKLAHELADCLWPVMILAQEYDVDLEQAFLATMDSLTTHIRQLSEPSESVDK